MSCFFCSSLTPELVPNSTEDSEEVTLIPPTSSVDSPTVILEPENEDHSDENLSDDEVSNPTTVIVTSPSFNSDLCSEPNDSQINHQRNKNEPVKSNSTEDLLSSTNNDSSISNNARDEPRRKSSTKIKQIIDEKTPPTSTAISRKKKLWYNVSTLSILFFNA